jgi:drug/metabolite transporter (DMT)-like permease
MNKNSSLGMPNYKIYNSYITEKSSLENRPSSGYVLLAAIALFWGCNWPIMKTVLTEIPSWTFRSLCVLCAGIGFFFIVKANGIALNIPKQETKPLLLVSFLNITGFHMFSAYGLMYTGAGRAAIINFTMPIWTTILSRFVLKEQFTLRQLAGLVLGMAGLIFLIEPDIKVLGSAPLGALFMLGAAISWAGGTVLLKYFQWTKPIVVLTGWQFILGGIPIIVGALTLEVTTVVFHMSWHVLLPMAYIIILPMIFCHWAWFTVVRLFPASVAAISTIVIPIIGVFSSALVLAEPIGFRELVALALVVVALAMILVMPKRFKHGREW